MQKKMACPVCGKENTRTYHTECVGLVEDYYYCPECGYFDQMAYSPRYTGILIPDNVTPEEHNKKFGQRIAELKLKTFLPGEIELM